MVPAGVGCAVNSTSDNFFKRKIQFANKFAQNEMVSKKIYSRNKTIEFKGLNSTSKIQTYNADIGLTARNLNNHENLVILPAIDSVRPASSKAKIINKASCKI